MTEAEAAAMFAALRWADNDGNPVCPRCGCKKIYVRQSRRNFICAECHKDFSLTSGTIFSGRKLPLGTLLVAIEKFVAGDQSIRQLAVDLRISYKSAYVLARKIGEALYAKGFGKPQDTAMMLASLIVSSPQSEQFTGYWKSAATNK